jgi:hypothetical protein
MQCWDINVLQKNAEAKRDALTTTGSNDGYETPIEMEPIRPTTDDNSLAQENEIMNDV